MPGFVPRVGEISYNGFIFSASCETLDFSVTPVEDEAQRTTIYNRYSITIKDYISGRPADAKVIYAQTVLSKNGGRFAYVNRGMGGIVINVGTVRDVAYGPKCRALSLKPVGGNNTVEIVWTVEIGIPVCAAAKYQFAPMDFGFRVNFDIDDDGLTTRIYSGHLVIPMTRNGPTDRLLHDSVDYYRERINPTLLPGFKRKPGNFSISLDKRRLEFTIEDREFFGPAPPPGVTQWEGSHTVSSGEAGLVKWTGAVNAVYNVAPGFSKNVAANHFNQLIADRVGFAAQQLGISRQAFIALSYSLGEPQLNGPRNASFSFTYTFVTTLDKILGGSGLWRPIPNSNWHLWAYSMTNVLGPRGLAGLRFTPNEDRIVDLCDPGGTIPPASGKPLFTTELRTGDLSPGGCPGKNDSWIAYENDIFVEGDDGLAPVKLLPKQTIKKPFTATLIRGGGVPTLPTAPGYPTPSTIAPLWANQFAGAGVLEPEFQQRAVPQVYVYLVGRAARACYPIPIPELKSDPREANGIDPVPANRLDKGEGFTQGIKYNAGVPVFVATWRMRYAIERHKVDKLPVPENPLAARRR